MIMTGQDWPELARTGHDRSGQDMIGLDRLDQDRLGRPRQVMTVKEPIPEQAQEI